MHHRSCPPPYYRHRRRPWVAARENLARYLAPSRSHPQIIAAAIAAGGPRSAKIRPKIEGHLTVPDRPQDRRRPG